MFLLFRINICLPLQKLKSNPCRYIHLLCLMRLKISLQAVSTLFELHEKAANTSTLEFFHGVWDLEDEFPIHDLQNVLFLLKRIRAFFRF